MTTRPRRSRSARARLVLVAAWVGSLAAVCAVCAIVLTASDPLVTKLAALGQLLAALGVLAAVASLAIQRNQMNAEYDWRVRQYTLELSRSWNDQARHHIDALSRAFPEFFRVPPSGVEGWRLPPERARELVLCEGEKPTESRPSNDIERDRVLRNHLISLLNYFETLALAYEQYIVDQEAVVDSFSSMMIDTYEYFLHFIDEMVKVNRRKPWPPLDRVVLRWQNDELRRAHERMADEYRAAADAIPGCREPVH